MKTLQYSWNLGKLHSKRKKVSLFSSFTYLLSDKGTRSRTRLVIRPSLSSLFIRKWESLTSEKKDKHYRMHSQRRFYQFKGRSKHQGEKLFHGLEKNIIFLILDRLTSLNIFIIHFYDFYLLKYILWNKACISLNIR